MIFGRRLIKGDCDVEIMAKTEQKADNQAEKVGFHKGSLATLSKEREELLRILQIVEQLMQMHVKELKDMGVDLVAQAKEEVKNMKSKKPIEDVLK